MVTLDDCPFVEAEKISWGMEMITRYYSKKITDEEKRRFLTLFEKLECMRRGILMKIAEGNDNQHICKVCGEQFESGRKLGGHMSRRHPGNSFEYFIKKQMQSTRTTERDRRKYFKDQRKGS